MTSKARRCASWSFKRKKGKIDSKLHRGKEEPFLKITKGRGKKWKHEGKMRGKTVQHG